jgi:hypothetical protein
MNERLFYLGNYFLTIGDHHEYLLGKALSSVGGAGLLEGMHNGHGVILYASD